MPTDESVVKMVRWKLASSELCRLLRLMIYRQAVEVWNYQASGYQVLDKYLYDRREKKLTIEEIQHYCKIVTSLYHTIELQQEIDEVFAGG